MNSFNYFIIGGLFSLLLSSVVNAIPQENNKRVTEKTSFDNKVEAKKPTNCGGSWDPHGGCPQN